MSSSPPSLPHIITPNGKRKGEHDEGVGSGGTDTAAAAAAAPNEEDASKSSKRTRTNDVRVRDQEESSQEATMASSIVEEGSVSPMTSLPNVLIGIIGSFLVLVGGLRIQTYVNELGRSRLGEHECLWSVCKAFHAHFPKARARLVASMTNSLRWAQQLNHRTCNVLPGSCKEVRIIDNIRKLSAQDPLRTNLHAPIISLNTWTDAQSAEALDRGWILFLKTQHPDVFATYTKRLDAFRADMDAFLTFDEQVQLVSNQAWSYPLFTGKGTTLCGNTLSPLAAFWLITVCRSPSGANVNGYIMAMVWSMSIHFGTDIAWTIVTWIMHIGIGTDLNWYYQRRDTRPILVYCAQIGIAFHPQRHEHDITRLEIMNVAEQHLETYRSHEFVLSYPQREIIIDRAPPNPEFVANVRQGTAFSCIDLGLRNINLKITRAKILADRAALLEQVAKKNVSDELL